MAGADPGWVVVVWVVGEGCGQAALWRPPQQPQATPQRWQVDNGQ